jgi:hypothetical protein
MTLATLTRASLIPKSSGRLKVREAARLLQAALDAFYEEDRVRDEETERRAREHIAKAEARRLSPRIEVDKAWLERFAIDALDAMGVQVYVARQAGQRSFPEQLTDRIGGYCTDLQKLGLMKRRGS